MLSVSPTSIKRWADSGALELVRTPGKHRRFTTEAVTKLRRALETSSNSSAPTSIQTREEAWFDLLASDPNPLRVAARILEARVELGSYSRVGDSFARMFDELGRRWQRGEITVLDEHKISAAFERGLAIVKSQLVVPPRARRCLFAAIEGDEHVLGLELAELCAKEAGWITIWGGRSTPTADIVAAIESRDLDMVAISASSWSSQKAKMGRIARTIAESAAENGVKVVFGGAGAWPDRVRGGSFVRSFEELAAIFDTFKRDRDRRQGRLNRFRPSKKAKTAKAR